MSELDDALNASSEVLDDGRRAIREEHLKPIVDAARRVANLDGPLRALNIDGHQWSSRPCQTCSDLTDVLGWQFGCAALGITTEDDNGD